MSQLRELQQAFGAYLFSPSSAAPIEAAIVSDEKGSAALRLGLYSDSYVLRLIEVLTTDFPGVHALLGDDTFDAMCREYIAAHPSNHPSIRWFGNKVYEFLCCTEPYCKHEVLLEMAAFERAKNQVFDAPDCETVSIDKLAQIDPQQWGQMRFEFVTAMQQLSLHNNVSLLWDAVQKEADALPDLERSEHPVSWLVWRQSLDPRWRSLDVDEAFMLADCLQGMHFAELCERLCEWVDEAHAPMRAVSMLKTWVEGQLIRAIHISHCPDQVE